MTITVLFFADAQELATYVEIEISQSRSNHIDQMRRLEAARKKYELAVAKTDKTGSSSINPGNAKRIELAEFRILVNPSPNHRLSILDESIASTQARLEALEKIEKHVLPKIKDYKEIAVIFEDGIPTAFMYDESS